MKRFAIPLAVASLLLTTSVFAGHGRGRGGLGHPDPVMMKKAMKDAGLSDQQIRRIETLRDESQRVAIDIRHELDKARLELKQLMGQYQVDESAVMALVEQTHAIKLRLKKERIGLKFKIRKELTPEQWEKLQAVKAEMRMKHGRKGGKRGGPGCGHGQGPR
jgi:Spy/CpxP family protein refolding chaperone